MASGMELSRGLVQVYTGDGKGKTTAALGLTMRAAGHGLKVYLAFFLKGDYSDGERRILSQLPGVTFESFGSGRFLGSGQPPEEEIKRAQQALEAGLRALQSRKYDVVVLDEVNVALSLGLVPVKAVLELIERKPPAVELLLTGRGAPRELVEQADLVTEMKKLKHPYDAGIAARAGIEY